MGEFFMKNKKNEFMKAVIENWFVSLSSNILHIYIIILIKYLNFLYFYIIIMRLIELRICNYGMEE